MTHRSVELESLYRALLLPYRHLYAGSRRPPPFRPLRRVAIAVLSVTRYGRDVAKEHSVSLGRQAIKLVRLLSDGFSVEDFYRYRLYRLSPDEAALFVPSQFNFEIRSNLYRELGVDADSIADKRRFADAAQRLGLPVAVTVADFSDGALNWRDRDSLPACDLFAKEARAMCGQGAMAWRWNGSIWIDEESGSGHDEQGLLARLLSLSKEAPFVLQQRLSNHSGLSDLSPRGLCTVRVVTFRSPSGPSPEILMCAFRIPTGGDIADNFARGGVACPVDVDTGTLGIAVLKDLQHAHRDIERHPDTGVAITGRQLPCWREVIALALRAHGCFPEYPSIGWDIAITDAGPVLIEANYNWDSVLAQQAACGALGATRWPSHVLEWWRARASATRQ